MKLGPGPSGTVLGTILADVGSSLSNIVQLTTYLIDEADIDGYVATRAALFSSLFHDGCPPNTLVVADARPAHRCESRFRRSLPFQPR